MSVVDTDAWTCPRCDETVRGSKAHRDHHKGIHSRRHGVPQAELVESVEPAPPTPLVIPAVPRERRRRR